MKNASPFGQLKCDVLSIIRLGSGRQLVNFFNQWSDGPIIVRSNSLTNGVVDRTWVLGSWVRILSTKLFTLYLRRT